ncbi:MAG: protease pro-enzyme activation domain-containing protein [Candidatus Sulfotelmatobacter sp.]
MRTLRSASVLAIVSTLIFSSICFAAPPVLISQNVDESKLVTLAGNTRPEANKENDRGLVADDFLMEHMFLQLKRSPAQEQQLQQFVAQQEDKSSPNFHHWLSAKEFGKRFGLAKQDLDTITRWLESHGFKVNVVYQNGLLIDFSGTAGQVRAAFHTGIHELDVKGEKHIANMSDPKIPAALAPAVVGIVSLHDFKPHAMYKPRANYTTSTGYYAVVPGDLATIYNLNPLFSAGISGQGQTIVVVEDSDVYNPADWASFRSVFGLSSFTDGSFTEVHPAPSSNCTDPGVAGAEDEAILDAEYASAAAPSAAIVLASCNDTATFGGLIAVINLLNASGTPPAIMSMSYGECEASNGATSNAAFNSAFEQAVTEGVSVFVSAGDDAAAGCDRNPASGNATHGIGITGWGSSPSVVSVGGTDFGDTFNGTNSTYWNATNSSTYESALSYIDEIPWNDSCASLLIAEFEGFSQTYGTSGFCNANGVTNHNFLNTVGGSGGPSGCATGSPSTSGVVSGTCSGWAKPSYQTLVGNPSDGVRDIPDVSLFAANGVWGHYYPICDTDPSDGGIPCTETPDNWPGGGGTSFSSPIMAGIQALVNQNAGGPQGNPNPVYYQLAANEYGTSGSNSCNSTLGNTVGSSCIFYDVTQGDMDVNCTGTNNCYLDSASIGVLSTSNSSYQPAYGTTAGWDFATGIGTVNAYNLVNAFTAAVTPTIASTGSPTLTVSAGVTTPATYAFSVAPQAPLTKFVNAVTLSCSFKPADPTLTNSSCNFFPSATIAAGSGTASVTMSIATLGPNSSGGGAKARQRADNRSPRSPWLPFSLPIAGVVLAGVAGRRLSKYSVLAGLCLALLMAGFLIACGGSSGGSSTPQISVTNVTSSPTSLYPNYSGAGGSPAWPQQTSSLSATVTNDSQNQGVTWTAAVGTIVSTGATTATYTAPTVVAGLPASDSIKATSVTDTTKSGQGSVILTPATVPNTYTVTVTATEGTGAAKSHTTVLLVVQ